MATSKGLARVAAINKQIATYGQAAPSASSGSSSSKTTSAPNNYVSTNPHDAPGYNPATDPTSSVYKANLNAPTQPITPKIPTTPINTSQPSPQTVQVNPPNADMANAIAGKGSALSSFEMSDPSSLQDYANQYKQRLATTKSQYQQAPSTQGEAGGIIQGSQPQTESTAVTNFFNPENPIIQDSTAQLTEWLNPEADRVMLNDHIKQLSADRAELAGMKTELMSITRIMDSTEGEIRSEIQSAGGVGTNTQILALSISRNSTLLKKAQLISDQIQSQTDLVNSDISLIGEEKQMAAQQFSQRMSLLQYQQQNNDRMFNAFKDNLNQIQKTTGWVGVLAAYQEDPKQMSYVDSLYGGTGSISRLATEEQKQAKASASITSGVSGGISATTQAIINNPNLFESLTPTKKGEVITQLQASGYDTSNLGLKGLSDSAIQSVAQTQKALDDLAYLKTKIQGNTEKLGPITGLAALNPWSSSRKLQADVDRVRQTVGKALEGGVLRKEDEEKYKKILATLTDTPETALYKIDALIGSINRDIETYKSLQQSAGRSMDMGASLQKAGSTTNVENLRTKYNY